jgi:hypothetical protein
MAYRLYIDEVGHDDLKSAHDERYRYLSLCGVIVGIEYADAMATPRFHTFRNSIFGQTSRPVIFHRKDILQRKGPFEVLNDDALRDRFDLGLIRYLKDTEYRVLSVVIDKVEMMQRTHWNQRHPYHFLMEILVEKFTMWLERQGTWGDIMPERRHGKKDRELEQAYAYLRRSGTRYVDAHRICKAIPSAKLKFRAKHDDETGLQICDVVAHPSHIHIRSERGHPVTLAPFGKQIVKILKASKYDRSFWGRIDGYGTKYLP